LKCDIIFIFDFSNLHSKVLKAFFLHNIYIILDYNSNINCLGGDVMIGLALAQCIHVCGVNGKELANCILMMLGM
jgi:hypothetical protein